jgi:hypothetical protein
MIASIVILLIIVKVIVGVIQVRIVQFRRTVIYEL